MNGRKAKAIRKQVYGSFPKKMNLDKVGLKAFVKDFFKQGMPFMKIISAWKYRKWWNALKDINPFRFNQYRQDTKGMLKNTGLRSHYKALKRRA